MQFGMPTLVENRTLEDNIALCNNLGLKFIELNMNFPEYQIDRLEQTDSLISLAEQSGIYYTIHLDENLNIADFNRLVSDAYLETVRRSIEVARKLITLRNRYGDSSQPMLLNMAARKSSYVSNAGMSGFAFLISSVERKRNPAFEARIIPRSL